MKSQSMSSSQRNEKKGERPTKAEKVYKALQKEKRRAEARKKESVA